MEKKKLSFFGIANKGAETVNSWLTLGNFISLFLTSALGGIMIAAIVQWWHSALNVGWEYWVIVGLPTMIFTALFARFVRWKWHQYTIISSPIDYPKLADDLTVVANDILQMLSEFSERIGETNSSYWNATNFKEQREKSTRIEAGINRRFEKEFKATSLSLLKRGCIRLEKSDGYFSEKTKVLTGHFLIDEHAKHMLEIAEEVRVKK